MTLRREGSDRGIPVESDYSYTAISRSLHPTLVQSQTTTTPDPPAALVSCVLYTLIYLVTVTKAISNPNNNPFNLCSGAESHVSAVMLTNFTISVVFLYGVVFGEAHSTHPFNAFRCG